jgi:hypothetical protein
VASALALMPRATHMHDHDAPLQGVAALLGDPAVTGKARCERHLRSCNEARKRSLDRKRLQVVAAVA